MNSSVFGSLDWSRLVALRAALVPLQEQISLAQLVSLLTIAAEPGLSVQGLADRIGAPQASTSRYVSVLLARYQGPGEKPPKPFIKQEVSTDDPRRRALFLNDYGKELVLAILGALQTNSSAAETSAS